MLKLYPHNSLDLMTLSIDRLFLNLLLFISRKFYVFGIQQTQPKRLFESQLYLKESIPRKFLDEKYWKRDEHIKKRKKKEDYSYSKGSQWETWSRCYFCTFLNLQTRQRSWQKNIWTQSRDTLINGGISKDKFSKLKQWQEDWNSRICSCHMILPISLI